MQHQCQVTYEVNDKTSTDISLWQSLLIIDNIKSE